MIYEYLYEILTPLFFAALWAAKGYSPDGQKFERFSKLWFAKHLSSKYATGIYAGLWLAIEHGLGAGLYAAIVWGLLWACYQKRIFLSQLTGGKWAGIDRERKLYKIVRRAVKGSPLNTRKYVRVYGAVVGFMYMLAFAPFLGYAAPLMLLKGFVWQSSKTDNQASLKYGFIFGLSMIG